MGDIGENGRRLGGDGPTVDEEKPGLKMPGSRQNAPSIYHNKDHNGSEDQKGHEDWKEEKDSKEHKDHRKADEEMDFNAAEATEVMDEECDLGQNRRGQGGETLLRWGQRKRRSYREPSSRLTASIGVDRRVKKKARHLDTGEYMDLNKAADATEIIDEDCEGQNQRGQDRATLLQWDQQKRLCDLTIGRYEGGENKAVKKKPRRLDTGEYMDLNKAADATEVMDEEYEGQNQRGQDGETLSQWDQRKRPRYREPSSPLKAPISLERGVVRADKRVAVQPALQSRGNTLRPSYSTVHEAASGTAKRNSVTSGSSALYSEFDDLQTSSGNQRQIGHQEEYRPQLPVLGHIAEEAPISNSGGHPVTAIFSVRRPDTESFPETSHPVEKMSLPELSEWPKILLSLTKKEKEDDFTTIGGTKLPQRPKRRPKTAEKNVQFISPGTWLCDLTPKRYEVREKKPVKETPRGLKAMGSVDSD